MKNAMMVCRSDSDILPLSLGVMEIYSSLQWQLCSDMNHRVPLTRGKPLVRIHRFFDIAMMTACDTEPLTNTQKSFQDCEEVSCWFYRFWNIKSCEIQAVFHKIDISSLKDLFYGKTSIPLQSPLVSLRLPYAGAKSSKRTLTLERSAFASRLFALLSHENLTESWIFVQNQ